MTWRCTGIRWSGGRPAVGWIADGRGERTSPLRRVVVPASPAGGERRCLGVRRAGKRSAGPAGAAVPAPAGNAQCPECARLDRSFSVAADTNAGDPRPYRVYLAWFGPGLAKVGITAEERGAARLLEQGAVAWAWLGRGPLMAGRRAEELLRTALGVPDRIPYARKRAVRSRLPAVGDRADAVAALHAEAAALEGWPQSLERLPCEVVDHAAVFGLDGLPDPARVVTAMASGGAVAGRLAAAAGPDLHFSDGLVLDTRLLAGWELVPAGGRSTDVPAVAVPSESGARQDGLF
ncbi:DUF2797 domain-containing protein [Streptomyces globosus]|uniref:DUF2797 domain-containing protein n=1 Tax=Streptomyces globosus TaxID=68209 RepID=UPI0031CE3D87